MGYSRREVLDPQQDMPDFADVCGKEVDAITPTKNDHEDGTAGSGTPFPADIDALLSLGTIGAFVTPTIHNNDGVTVRLWGYYWCCMDQSTSSLFWLCRSKTRAGFAHEILVST